MAIGLVLAMVFCYASSSLAGTAVGTDSAAVNLRFQVLIQNYIEFRVGLPTGMSTINFSPDPDQLFNSTPITGTGGNVAGSQVTVRLLSNTPSITLTATNDTNTGLINGTETIDWLSIATTDLGGATGDNLTPPLLNNAGNQTSPDILNGPQDIDTVWEYQYTRRAGDSIPTVNGNYVGTVTYTATSP